MRSKKIHFSGIIPMLALGMTFVLSACEDNKDLYNPERVQEEAKKAFPVKDIDPNQTWETSAVCNASVSVNEKDGETYTIKVYTSNPYNVNSSDVFLLAKTTVANGKTANFKFDIPAALQYVYVMKVNSEGYSSAVPVAVTDGSMNVTFGGESTETRMATTRGATTRANIWSPSVPSLTDTEIFPQEAPTAEKYTGQWEIEGGSDYIVASATQINCNHAANFYITENTELSSLYFGGSNNPSKIFILDGATLTVNALTVEMNLQISVNKGATLKCGSINLSNASCVVYNAGTIEVAGTYYDSRADGAFYNLGTFEFTEANLSNPNFYNAGTITATKINNNNSTNFINAPTGKVILTDKFSCENGASIAVNEGNITAGSFGISGGSFYNESTGTVKIKGLSELNTDNTIWNNAGYFETDNMKQVSGGGFWINSCKLYVNKVLTIGTSSATFIMDADSYTECQDLDIDMSRIQMRSGSFFNVKGTAYLGYNTNENGFVATGDKALLKIETAKPRPESGTGYMQKYSGKLYIACSNHLIPEDKYICENSAVITGADNADITIEVTTCTPVGYEGTADEDKDGDDDDDDDSDDKYPLLSYAYAFEDMTKEALTDYDFNDVVLYVTTPYKKGGQNVVDVTLKAAGASKQLTVFFKDLYSETAPVAQNIFGEKGGEVHTVFGVEPGTLINTGIPADTEAKTETKESVTVTVKVSDGFSITEHGDFYIVDEKGKEVHIPNFTPGFKKGNVPYAIRVASTTWKWAKERVSITEAYKGFEEWAQDAMKEPTWYDSPVSGNVY